VDRHKRDFLHKLRRIHLLLCGAGKNACPTLTHKQYPLKCGFSRHDDSSFAGSRPADQHR
jgi:hypothetical protein